jgi:hypothetical protein
MIGKGIREYLPYGQTGLLGKIFHQPVMTLKGFGIRVLGQVGVGYCRQLRPEGNLLAFVQGYLDRLLPFSAGKKQTTRQEHENHLEHTVERIGTARWRTGIPASGIYEVEIHYRPTKNRTPDADFFVHDGNGTVHHYSVDQTCNGPLASSGWLTLGRFFWSAMQTAQVVLDGTDDNHSDEADAVRWTLVEKTAGVDPYMQMPVLQQLLLNKPGAAASAVNLAGDWLETGKWAECLNTGTSTRLEVTIRYFNGRYIFVKNGYVQNPAPDCGIQVVDSYGKIVAPTSQLVSSSVFIAMMREIFSQARGVDVLYFSKNRITYRIYDEAGTQTRTFTRQ